MSIPEGRAWVYGDNIDTDQLAPIKSYKNMEAAEGCKFCLDALDADFAGAVENGVERKHEPPWDKDKTHRTRL